MDSNFRFLVTRPSNHHGRRHCFLENGNGSVGELKVRSRAKRAGVKNGVVQDKLFLPGLSKLRKLYDADFFGRILSIRLDFGWWVFDGTPYPAQRPSWNYRKATGGGLILDMFAHWRYIFDRLLGEITRKAASAMKCRRTTLWKPTWTPISMPPASGGWQEPPLPLGSRPHWHAHRHGNEPRRRLAHGSAPG
jgi:GFO/IDH/MocA oxidoreductase family protein